MIDTFLLITGSICLGVGGTAMTWRWLSFQPPKPMAVRVLHILGGAIIGPLMWLLMFLVLNPLIDHISKKVDPCILSIVFPLLMMLTPMLFRYARRTTPSKIERESSDRVATGILIGTGILFGILVVLFWYR